MRQRYPTDYAKANYAYSYLYSDNDNATNKSESQWFLRSPRNDNKEYAFMVHMLGEAGGSYPRDNGFYVKDTDRGVVPALVVSVSE